MIRLRAAGLLLLATVAMNSCVVSNGLYFNDASPSGKGEGEFHAGIGSGIAPRIDSVVDEQIFFSNRYIVMPVITAGGRIGISPKTDIRIDLKFLGGLGLRAGIQHSFLKTDSRFNVAVGSDCAFTATKDSIFHTAINRKFSDFQVNADAFVAFTFCATDDLKFTLSPRCTFGSYFVREYTDWDHTHAYSFTAPMLTFGAKYRSYYFEASGVYFHNSVMPLIGIGYVAFDNSGHKSRKKKQGPEGTPRF